MEGKKIIIMFPTREEGSAFMRRNEGRYETAVSGVGLAECAARTAAVIAARKPGLLILAGIAGCYPGSGLKMGDSVLVERENSADLGSTSGNTVFRPLSKHGGRAEENFYTCNSPLPGIFPRVTSNSVNTAPARHVNPSLGPAAIENMEGAAFFAVCEALATPCLELRVVSNIVGEGPETWNIEDSAETLAAGLEKLLAAL